MSQTTNFMTSSSTYSILLLHISLFFFLRLCVYTHMHAHVSLCLSLGETDEFIYFLSEKECHRPEWFLGNSILW